jgi:hypothetical protein
LARKLAAAEFAGSIDGGGGVVIAHGGVRHRSGAILSFRIDALEASLDFTCERSGEWRTANH